MLIEKSGKIIFIKFDSQVTKIEIRELLGELWKNKFDMSFHDAIYPSISDSGAYFSYSTLKTIGNGYWSMTLGNHGWSGGIYHIKQETLIQQIFNLYKKRELDKIQITEVTFFVNYEIESKEKSTEKDKEIFFLHI